MTYDYALKKKKKREKKEMDQSHIHLFSLRSSALSAFAIADAIKLRDGF